jgi:PEP-CTERM motif
MKFRTGFSILVALAFALAMSVVGFAQAPCNFPGIIYCQTWDGSGNAYSSQNDTNGFGNFATVYDNFTLTHTYDVESFHWVGEYFNPPNQSLITAWTLTFYNDNNGTPGNAIASGVFAGTANETFLGYTGGFPTYEYSLYFGSFDMGPGTYWASVVPDLGFPPQWGWSTSAQGDGLAYQCFFGACGTIGGGGVNTAFALDTPEPSTLIMVGTGILGLAGTLRRKINL